MKASETTRSFIKSKKADVLAKKLVEEIIVSPEKRGEMLDELRKVL